MMTLLEFYEGTIIFSIMCWVFFLTRMHFWSKKEHLQFKKRDTSTSIVNLVVSICTILIVCIIPIFNVVSSSVVLLSKQYEERIKTTLKERSVNLKEEN